jgi:hypothetical protein
MRLPLLNRREAIAWLISSGGLAGHAVAFDLRLGSGGETALRNSALRAMRVTDSSPSWFTSANWDNRAYGPWTDYVAGRMADAEFMQVCANTSDYCLRDVWNLRKRTPDRIDWRNPTRFNWNGIHALALRFFRTGDAIYLGKWLDVVTDYADFAMVSLAPGNTPLQRGQPAALLDAAFVWGGIFTAFCILAKGLGPAERSGGLRTGSPFAPQTAEIETSALDVVPAATLMKIASALASGPGVLLARFYADAKYVPNQRVYGLEVLANLDAYFTPLPAVASLRPTLQTGMQDVFTRYRQLDGGQLEQSFNYAQDVISAGARSIKLPFDRPPPWRPAAELAVTGWSRMAAALATPTGGLPQVGNAAWGRFGREPPAASFVQTSLAFPYSGFYAMRSAWTPDAAYLFFFNRRAARGHSMAGSNSLQVAAFGRPLLIAGGAADYRKDRPDASGRAYRDEGSSWKTNTVLVDGRSQRGASTDGLARDARGQPDITVAPVAPIQARWHASATFDYAEGRFAEGYGPTLQDAAAAPVLDVTHQRQVVFVRPLLLWLVVDVLRSAGTHRYTQVWKFAAPGAIQGAPGFTRNQVVARDAERLVRTADESPGAVNLALQQFGVAGLAYRSHFGDGAYGWHALGPVAEAVPAVDVHAEWSAAGPQVLITVITPYRGSASPLTSATDLSSNSRAGCRLETRDGARLTVAAAAAPSLLQVGDLNATDAELFLLLQRPGQPNAGLLIGPRESNEFGPRDKIAIRIPEGHRWVTGSDGRLEARYDKA